MTKIILDRFKPRDYQLPLIDAYRQGYTRIVGVLPRRAGKDLTAFNIALEHALCRGKANTIFYIGPTYSQMKKLLWEGLTNDGHRVIDYYVPDQFVVSKNSQQMSIRFNNGSQICLVGSDNVDSLVGTNPSLCIFTEYALQSDDSYKFLRPILAANAGQAIFISTPRGKNHMYQLYEIAKDQMKYGSADWFAYRLTLDDTQHIPLSEIEKDRQEGIMSDDLIQQEYYCSFDAGIEGAYYTKYIDRMKLRQQIGDVPWEPALPVFTCFDIGVRDSTSIIFFQVAGPTVRIIDFYEKSKEGLEHYVQVIKNKPYQYSKHIAPHDIKVREFGSGITRIEKARQLGITFTVANDTSIVDGIEAVRTLLPKCYIDSVRCAKLITALENYRQEYDNKLKVYKAQPLHDSHSHAADAMRYLAVSLPKTRDGMTSLDIERNYAEAMYGVNNQLPKFFQNESY